ncbi:MAG: SusC/RagA family TonB-linked outer membrane protein [Saprospiraceae bacterium]
MSKWFLLIINILFCLPVIGQIAISGVVLDTEANEKLIGASILEKGTTNGAVTDIDGDFAMNIQSLPATLEVNYLGYAPFEYEVTQAGFQRIELGASDIDLDEVVVTALGLKRSSKALGYAIQKIDGAELNEVKAVNFLDNLSGKLAGVRVTAGATGVGSTSKITIRGEASFANNNPLFVVDGIPINNNTVVNITDERAAGFQEVDFGNGAMDVNPADVASISVLKGPSAAALYGTRASNGVVIINTKDGDNRPGLGISLNQTTYVETLFTLPEYQNSFGQGNNGQFEFKDGLGGGINDNITYSYGPRLDAGINLPQFDSPVTLPDGSMVRGGDVAVHGGQPITPTPFISRPDNVRDFYETGITNITSLALSGGYDRGNYRLSLSNLNSESVIPGVNLDRKNLSAKLNFNPTPKFKLSTALNYINSQSDNRPNNGYGSENINYALTAWLGRQTDLGVLKDYWQPGLEDVQHYSFNYTFFDNPYFILNENRNAFNRDRLFGNIMATYEINPALSISLRSGMDYSNELRQLRRAFSTNRFRNGAYAENTVYFREINTDLLLSYQKKLGMFDISVSAGANRMDQQASTAQIQTAALAQPGVFQLSNAAAPLEILEMEAQKRINSVYGIAKLGYRNLVYLDITGRNDWSSALATPFATENTSFFYPSVSLSFITSNAFELPDAISFAKLRASWAQVGNDTDPYRTSGVFLARTPFNGQPTFSDQASLPNTALLPEQTTSVEFGADVRFFDDRLSVDFTYYNALTENQILSLPIAASSGYDERILNGGAVRAEGVEIIVGVNPIRNEKFNWMTYFNFSSNRAIVESLPEAVDRLTLGYSRVYDNPNQTVWFQVREGDQIGDLWGTGYLKNENGDFVIGADGRYIVDNSLKKLGNYNPDFILGINNRISYKNWNLGFLIDWRQGGELVSRTLSLAGVAGQLIETESRPEAGIVAEGVVNTGTAAEPIYAPNTQPIPAESYYRQFYDRNHEENNVYDATYLKLRELSLGYSLNKAQLQNTFLRSFQQINLSIVGRNLFAFSEIPHFDPEQLSVQGQQFVQGVEDMSYPTTRSIGINLGFEF